MILKRIEIDTQRGWKICNSCLLKLDLKHFLLDKTNNLYETACRTCRANNKRVVPRIKQKIIDEIKGYKKCSICKNILELKQFYFSPKNNRYENRCKECGVKRDVLRKPRKPTKIRQYNIDIQNGYKICSECNIKKDLIEFQCCTNKNKTANFRKRCKKCLYKAMRENPVRVAKNNQRQSKYNKQLKYNLDGRIARALNHAIKDKQGQKWQKILGYSSELLILHIQKQFTKEMSWEKFLNGEIEIHHFFPKRLFLYESHQDPEFQLCWNLNNLKPEWSIINTTIQDKLPFINVPARDLKETERQNYIEQYVKPYFAGFSQSESQQKD